MGARAAYAAYCATKAALVSLSETLQLSDEEAQNYIIIALPFGGSGPVLWRPLYTMFAGNAVATTV